MPVKRELMNTMTTRKICQATPMAAFPAKPTKCPTMAWSTMPWSPPRMFWSIVGQAIFHTTLGMGPSTIERSNGSADARAASDMD